MIAPALRSPEPGFALPPGFTFVGPRAGVAVHDFACEITPHLGAGTLTGRAGEHVVELAVVLEPEEPLRAARRAVLVCMAALADAVGAWAPPEKPVTAAYPDILAFDGGRIGGGRLGSPSNCDEDDVPDWLVFSAMIIASKQHAGDPGLTPDTTALDEEGFEPEASDGIVEAFARYLLLGFDAVRDRGFEMWSEAYLRRVVGSEGARLDAAGDFWTGGGDRIELAPVLAEMSWFDAQTGAPRL